MYKQLIDHLAFTYSFICKGRGKVKEEDLVGIADGAHAIVKNAPAVLGSEDERPDDRADLADPWSFSGCATRRSTRSAGRRAAI